MKYFTFPKNGPELLFALKKYFQPWKRLYLVEGTLQKHGLQPFVDILNIPIEGNSSDFQSYHNPLFRALAIQSFSYIQTLAEKEKIASLKSVFSRNLLSILQKEATGGANQLIRWSAAKTINSIWFDPQWSEHKKHDYSLNAEFHISNTRIDRIQKQITEQELDRLDRLKNICRKSKIGNGEFSEDYKEYLEFWVYGPSSVLFNLTSNSLEYQYLINDVLGALELRGIKLGVESINNLVVELSLKFAKDIFNYSGYHQREISNCLKGFLNSDSEMQVYQPKAFDFRKLAAESIVKLKDELWKNDNNLKYLKARAAVILQDWKLVEQLGEIAVFSLIDVGKGFLQLEVKPNLNLDIQIKAVGTIGKIKFKNDAKKINALCQFLQLPEQRIRYESALLLRPYLNDLKPKSYAIVTALLYEFNNKSLFSSLDISSIEQIKKYINDAENEQRAINYIFEKASDSCENNAFDVKKKFVKKLNEYKKIIKLHIEKLKGHLSKVEKLQALVQQNAQFILSTLQGIKSDYPDLYTQLIDWEKKAKEIKNTSLSSYPFNKVVECQQKIEDLKNGIYSGLLEAIQDLENNLEILIKNLNFTRSEKNINYLGDAEIKKDAIYDAFLSLFSERYGNNEKFYESLFQIQRYLEILNERLSKIKELQGLGKPNTKLILSTLPQTKKLEDSIVLIRSAKRANVIGTGFIFYKQQNYTYLLTCAHVVEDVGGEENIRVNNIPAEVIKIGDVQGFDLAVLKVNKTFSAPSLNLMILYGEEEKKLKVKIPGYYFFSQNHALRHETIKGEMVVEVDGERAFQLIENIPEYVAVEKLQMEKGSLRSGYSGSPVIDINTGLVVGIVTHKVDVDGEGRFGRAISIEALEKIWTEIPNEVSKQIKRESRESDKGELFTFEVVKVNDSGSIINRSQESARQKIEDLGNGIKLEMVYIPEGSFLMGSPESEEDRNDSESP
mgnify:FL=1